jgi:integrase
LNRDLIILYHTRAVIVNQYTLFKSIFIPFCLCTLTPLYPKWFKKFIKKNSLPYITFHQLRHTNASLLIGQDVDVATVSKRLGHADKSVTLRTYAHAIKEHDREAADALGNLLKKKK